MKIVSWNVNGLRAARKKGFDEFFTTINADIFAIQETKMQEDQKDFTYEGYYEYWNSADKKGYSGTLIYSKLMPSHVAYGIHGKYNDEGRIITLQFDDFYFVTCYSPNSGENVKRLDYRLTFEEDFRHYLCALNEEKPVILCGDLNVAHHPIDLKNPKNNVGNAGYTDEEREKFTKLLSQTFIDTFRYLYPQTVKYSWWSYRYGARKRNAGWRLDYFVISEQLLPPLKDSLIHDTVHGSDHCPIELKIAI